MHTRSYKAMLALLSSTLHDLTTDQPTFVAEVEIVHAMILRFEGARILAKYLCSLIREKYNKKLIRWDGSRF